MDANEPTVHLTADELSDRSNSSNSGSQLHAFQEYGKVKELNLSLNKSKQSMICKAKDFSIASEHNQFENLPSDASTTDRIASDLPLSLERSRNFGYSDEKSKSASSFSIDNLEDTDTSVDATKDYTAGVNRSIKDTKDIIFGYDQFKDNSYCRDQRAKNIHFAIDVSKESAKAFNYSLDRKDFSFALDPRRDILVGANAPDHFRSGNFRDVIEHRATQIQHRHLGFGTLSDRIRRPHVLAPDLQAHLSHSITQMQNSPQQQQQQCKSFTIDAILGLGNNPRDKQQRGRYNPYRKHQGQEGSTKNNSSGSSSGGSGKLKRVRTIFTAEQLERLEGEFARQQYMVGPERLYLAHALRLSEAQVKVWFQNRRIKWRKLSREQQTQHRHTSLEQEVEDSNGNVDWSDTTCPKNTNLLELRTGNRDSAKILETISEHTEPSPTASATMDQPELESQTQTRKTRTGRQVASRSPATWSSRLPAQGSNSADTYWKSRPTQSNSHSHSRRKPDYDATEPVTSFSASNTYRPKQRALSSSGFPKLPHTASSDQTYRMPRQTLRSTRNKQLTGSNYAVVRKSCYKPDLEDEDDTKYEDEEVAYTEDNAEDEGADEADEDQDDNDQYNDKEYEEQEADDEIDDESDAFQSQLHRTQPVASKDLNPKNHHSRHPDPQLDLRKLRRQQHAHKLYQEQKFSRYCSPSYEAEHATGQDTSYGDVADLMTDEERTPPPSPSRRSTMRASDIRSVIPPWQQPRKSLERHRTRTMPVSSQQRQSQAQSSQHHRPQYQPCNRLRSLKPEVESLMMPQATNTVVKKCYICKDSTNPIFNKIRSAMRGNYRLQEYRGFTVKGPPGEDGEAVERSICARCAIQLNMGDFRANCEAISNPESHCDNKLHRLRTYRPKNYEAAEDQTVDDMSSVFGSAPSRTVDYAVPHDSTRHSIQSTRSPLRRTSCYER